MIITSTA